MDCPSERGRNYPDLVIIYKSPLASIKHKFISSSKPLSHFATSRRSWDVIKSILFSEYDIIFIDECSTIDNQTMKVFLEKLSPDSFLVLAGDIYQIESIDFENWFFYAKDIIKTRGAKVELLNTWRTDDQSLISLWDEVRKRDSLITEKLVIYGPFSENIGPNVLRREEKDEVILCLNYDGKFGLNNMNNYFQTANKKGNAVFGERVEL